MRLKLKEPYNKDSTGHMICPKGHRKFDVDLPNRLVVCELCDYTHIIESVYDKNDPFNWMRDIPYDTEGKA